MAMRVRYIGTVLLISLAVSLSSAQAPPVTPGCAAYCDSPPAPSAPPNYWHERQPSAAEIRREKERDAAWKRYRIASYTASNLNNHGLKAAKRNKYLAAMDDFNNACSTIRQFDPGSEGGLQGWKGRALQVYRNNAGVAQLRYAKQLWNSQNLTGALDYFQRAAGNIPDADIQAEIRNYQQQYAAMVAQQRAETQRKAEEARNLQGMRSSVDRLSQTAVVEPTPDSSGLDFAPSGAATSPLRDCGNSALGQLNCAAQYGHDALNANSLEKMSDTAQVPFDKPNPGFGPPPAKLKEDPAAFKRYQQLTAYHDNLQQEHQRLVSQMEVLRRQRPPDSQPTPDEATLKQQLLHNETEISITRRAIIDLTVPFEEEKPDKPK